jgi:hypothetical protein
MVEREERVRTEANGIRFSTSHSRCTKFVCRCMALPANRTEGERFVRFVDIIII